MPLQKSKNWDEYQDKPGFTSKEYFHEGWPNCSHGDLYEIITSRGERLDVYVDLSMQYCAEGKQWRTFDGEAISKYHVIAWREKAV